MASAQERKDKTGNIISYQIKVSRGRDVLTGKQLTPFTMTWTPPATWETWSQKAKARELDRIKGEFESACKRGEVLTKEQEKEKALKESQEMTFSNYSKSFLATETIPLSINTKQSYTRVLDKVNEIIGNIKLKDITPIILKELFLNIQTNVKSKKNDQLLSIGTIRAYFRVLHTVFNKAVIDQLIPYSPMQQMKPPKPRSDEVVKETEAYSPKEIKRLLECAQNEPLMWQAWIYFAIDSGCRNGEIVGLKWSDIDFATGEVTIARNAQNNAEKGVYITTPKNKQNRTIYINPQALGVMKKWMIEQKAYFFQMGFKNSENWCFTQENGKLLHPGSPREHLKRFGKKYGFSNLHPHSFRHTMASIAISEGADIVSVSKKLGHSSTAITLNVYAHANEEAQRRANDLLKNAIYGEEQEAL